MTPTKILAGVKPSPESQAALSIAVDEARESGAELILAGYVERPRGEDGRGEDYEEARSARIAELEEIAASLQADGVVARAVVPAGMTSAADALILVASQEDVDLIVIGIRRRSRVGKLLMGSNAQSILLRAECPVLAVKAPEQM